MPMIVLSLPTGVLDQDSRNSLRMTLAETLLHWEGAPDTDVFRALTWVRVDEVPDGGFGSLGDDLPRFRVDVTVPAGALSDRRKTGLVQQVTTDVLNAAGLEQADALRVWVLIHEQPDGTWGAGGGIIRLADLVTVAKATKEQR
ncbi:tautomerase family protein [Gordonia sp. ABSL1-1]|uniref:tautomerase family protein n=1 Tax=Gordonia sp. ABSL1-1 TaxID=3053923 RepID=UPI002572307C|nr:tautomerase family protein [Gordonia sp. ABSL1-1]MDL9935274.1 tautomerase family protein [Gordonia sp. ABSL1-1]